MYISPDWEGIFERLRKLGMEFSEDRRHGIVQAFEGLGDPIPVGWRPLLERYIEDQAEFHLHARHGDGVVPELFDAPDLCATFQWPKTVLLNDSERVFWLGGTNIAEVNDERSEMKVAVLVDVPKLIENRKRFFGRILPTVKRLQLLEVCAETWSDPPEAIRLLGPDPRDEGSAMVHRIGVGMDRKDNLPPLAARIVSSSRYNARRGVAVGEGELPDKVVERRAEIVDHVSDDGTPSFDRQPFQEFTVDDYFTSLWVGLRFNSIRAPFLRPRPDLFLERFQVHIRPVDLGPASVQGMTHGLKNGGIMVGKRDRPLVLTHPF